MTVQSDIRDVLEAWGVKREDAEEVADALADIEVGADETLATVADAVRTTLWDDFQLELGAAADDAIAAILLAAEQAPRCTTSRVRPSPPPSTAGRK